MAVLDILNDVKKKLDEIRRNRKFKKAILDREAKTKLLVEIAQCNGQLNSCLVTFEYAMVEQVKNIKEGQAGGYDTIANEQILWDSAIGYMLVKDAMFALKTVTSYDSLTNAYKLLNRAIKQISGAKNKTLKRTVSDSGIDTYGYLNSEDIIKEKEELLDSFFEELKKTGDIEACIKNARDNNSREGTRRYDYSSSLDGSKAKARLNEFDDFLSDSEEETIDFDEKALAEQALMGEKPPVTTKEGV